MCCQCVVGYDFDVFLFKKGCGMFYGFIYYWDDVFCFVFYFGEWFVFYCDNVFQCELCWWVEVDFCECGCV